MGTPGCWQLGLRGSFGVVKNSAAAAAAASQGGLRRRMPLRRAAGIGGGTSTAFGGHTGGGRAMRYYRLWIYTCNTCLLAGAFAFAGAAARTVFFDFRRALVPSLTLYQPSFLYGYLALATQGGAIQLLGCLAGLRLSEKLLNAYWLLLLVLLFGDIALGAFWAFRFERICQELKPALKLKFYREYGENEYFTEIWNRLEKENLCCGVSGPHDYNASFVQLPIPASCCVRQASQTSSNSTSVCENNLHHMSGCDERLLIYLRSTASLLAILGYCVLAFLKMCFLGILRYEIREMIQKIRILRAELETTNANGAVPGTLLHCNMATDCTESEQESLLVRPESAVLLSSPPSVPQKNPNGNNNYELREYRSHDNI